MNVQELVELSDEDKNNYWEFFTYERALMDAEEDLTRDYEYYNKRLKSLRSSGTFIDDGIETVYHAHLNSIRRLLNVLGTIKGNENGENDQNKQLNMFNNF